MSDLIRRDQAIEAISKLPVKVDNLGYTWMIAGDVLKQIDTIPSAEPERIIKIGQRSGKTLESAINYLQSIGWLQEHDRILTESAEPERKKGKWIKEDLSGYLTPGGNSIYHCSECGHTEGPWPHPRLTNFCPSCGANMRGE